MLACWWHVCMSQTNYICLQAIGLQAAPLSDISQRVNLGRLYCGDILENQWLVGGWDVGWQG